VALTASSLPADGNRNNSETRSETSIVEKGCTNDKPKGHNGCHTSEHFEPKPSTGTAQPLSEDSEGAEKLKILSSSSTQRSCSE
jgi:hypothetical protein